MTLRPCKGCQCELPAGYLDCDGDNRHASASAVKEAIEVLGKLTRVDRAKALQAFCRSCSVKLMGHDWSGRNFCTGCSPPALE